jgi:hypothetical protein
MGAFPHPVGGRAGRVGVAGDAGPAPFGVEGVGVGHVEIGRARARRVVHGQVQVDAVPPGEAVLVAAVVGMRAEAERGVVGQRRAQVADGEDRAEPAQLAGGPAAAPAGAEVGGLDLGQGDQRRSPGSECRSR